MITIDEARAAYEAALQVEASTPEAEAVKNARDALASAIYEEAVRHLDDTYELVYVDYSDRLSDREVAALVKGDEETLWDCRDQWEADQWEAESRWDGARYVVENNLDLDENDIAILKVTDRYNDLMEEIQDRDNSTWLTTLIRNTPAPLLRINCIDEDHAFSFQPVEPWQILTRIGFEGTEHNVNVVRKTLLECSPEYSVVMGYWLCVIDLKVLADCPLDGKIRVTNPVLFLGSPFAGSGFFDDPLHGEVVLDRSELRTDKDAFGYSVDDIFGLASTRFAEVKAEIVTSA